MTTGTRYTHTHTHTHTHTNRHAQKHEQKHTACTHIRANTWTDTEPDHVNMLTNSRLCTVSVHMGFKISYTKTHTRAHAHTHTGKRLCPNSDDIISITLDWRAVV